VEPVPDDTSGSAGGPSVDQFSEPHPVRIEQQGKLGKLVKLGMLGMIPDSRGQEYR
jgi:hypothetical protein